MTKHKNQVRCYYNGTLAPEFDATVHRAAGRTSSFSGFDFRMNRRDLGWYVTGPFAAAQLRQRLRTCPEVTIVETPDG